MNGFFNFIFTTIFRIILFLFKNAIAEGIQHAYLLVKHGKAYRRLIDKHYSKSFAGRVGRFSTNAIMFFWVIILAVSIVAAVAWIVYMIIA